MKILKVKLKNIHSLKGEHEVDFANRCDLVNAFKEFMEQLHDAK
jgi:hypothetical protein